MSERRLDALRNDVNLARFVTQGRRTGRQLGTGSYGSVEEVLTDLNSDSTSYLSRVCFTVLANIYTCVD